MPEGVREVKAYVFGDFRLQPRTRILFKGGQALNVPPKVYETLLALVRSAGQVVRKEELMATVWQDTAVEEGSLTQSIFTLRRTLGELPGDHRFIVTIPGRGYSFVAPVRIEHDDEEEEYTGRKLTMKLAGGITVALLASAGWLLYQRVEESGRMPELGPFTSLPGGEYEPSFSPDGTQMAFVWNGEREDNFDIYVSPVPNFERRRLTRNAAGEGSPTWSPDGKEIAFLRISTKADVTGIFVMPAEGGEEKRIGDFAPMEHIWDSHLDWSPDGRYLAVADKEPGTERFNIYLVSPADGKRRKLTDAPPTTQGDTGPKFSRDCKRLAFRRSVSSSAADIYLVDVEGGEPKRLTHDNRWISNHGWTSDGSEILFTSNRGGPQMLWRVKARGGSPSGGMLFGEGAYFLTVSPRNNYLAFSRFSRDTDIWKVDLRKGTPERRPMEKLISSTRQDTSPQYSPDGQRIVFRSDRGGSDEIWVSTRTGQELRQLTNFRGPLTGTPRWSPDGLWVAFDSRPEGNSDIYVVSELGGPPRRMTADAADDVVPSYSRDGRWLYFASNRTGNWQVWKVDPRLSAGTAPQATQVTRDGGFAAFESSDGGTLYYCKGRDSAGLWKVPTDGGAETPVLADYKPGYWGHWGPATDGIYYIEPDPAQPKSAVLCFLRFADRRTLTAAKISRQLAVADSTFSVAADGSSILFSPVEREGSDIVLVSNFR